MEHRLYLVVDDLQDLNRTLVMQLVASLKLAAYQMQRDVTEAPGIDGVKGENWILQYRQSVLHRSQLCDAAATMIEDLVMDNRRLHTALTVLQGLGEMNER